MGNLHLPGLHGLLITKPPTAPAFGRRTESSHEPPVTSSAEDCAEFGPIAHDTPPPDSTSSRSSGIYHFVVSGGRDVREFARTRVALSKQLRNLMQNMRPSTQKPLAIGDPPVPPAEIQVLIRKPLNSGAAQITALRSVVRQVIHPVNRGLRRERRPGYAPEFLLSDTVDVERNGGQSLFRIAVIPNPTYRKADRLSDRTARMSRIAWQTTTDWLGSTGRQLGQLMAKQMESEQSSGEQPGKALSVPTARMSWRDAYLEEEHLPTLGLDIPPVFDRDFFREVVKPRYYELAGKNHPDVNPSPEASKRFQDCAESYRALEKYLHQLEAIQ